MLLPFKNLPRFLILLKINYELFPISWKALYNQTPAYLSALIYYHCPPLLSSPETHQCMYYSEHAKVNHRAFVLALPLASMVLPQILNRLSDTNSPIQ